ncbi:hypothetical protein SDC9_174747 [bioreactor metagenome]|uniref:Uncharacterized protein n=1 Tax=bioreactor metagenome TaxID=1076179 RepID=A0A645GM75_9ZZZZ
MKINGIDISITLPNRLIEENGPVKSVVIAFIGCLLIPKIIKNAKVIASKIATKVLITSN